MPAKFRTKDYQPDGIYHIYNKGVDGRDVFLEAADYEKFEEILGKYLGKNEIQMDNGFKGDRPYRIKHKQEMNLCGQMELWAYCLMPSHFHLLVKQQTSDGIVKLMRRVITYYVMYFNQKYHRQGTLFAGVYRAVKIPEGITAVRVSRYIHLNPGQTSVKRFGLVATTTGTRPEDYMYSSFQAYTKKREIPWVNTYSILKDCPSEYSGWVEDIRTTADEGITGLTID